MVQINFASREVNCKIVYYGPGRCGKTTNLQVVHAKAPASSTGELVSIATETDRTLYFDFLPLDLGTVAGMRTKFQLYTVPGQVYYEATRKLVLQGCDGIVFVADSNPDLMKENIESLDDLTRNLADNNLDIMEIAIVLQYNKRDLPNALSVDEMNTSLNRNSWPTVEAVAVNGDGVFQTLKVISQQVIKRLNREQGYTDEGKKPGKAAAVKPPTAAAPAAPPPPPAAKAPAPPPPPPAAAAKAPAPPPVAAAKAPASPPAVKAPAPAPVAAAVAQVPAPAEAPANFDPQTPAEAWKNKNNVFRERMAEIKKSKSEAMPKPAATGSSATAPTEKVKPVAEPVPATGEKKKGCMGMLLLGAGILFASIAGSMHLLS